MPQTSRIWVRQLNPLATNFAPSGRSRIWGKRCRSPIALETVLEAYLGNLFSWRDRWMREGVGPVREAWMARAVGIGGPITVRLPDREIVGKFSDMDADGALLLELPDGVCQRITAGDVFL